MMEISKQWVLRAALVIAGASALACNQAEEIPLEALPEIPAPTALAGYLSSDGVQLYWDFDSTYAYGGFVIERSEDDQATWFVVATVSGPPYSDKNLRSQTTYWYRVSGLDQDGLRGDPSVSWPATPAVYEVLIDNGEPKTGTRDVFLTFTAPALTQNVRFAQDSVLTGVQWRDFLAQYPFTLTAGDGEKTVWAQFIDVAGNLTQPVSASIELDTYAGIDTLSFVTFQPAVADTIEPGGTVEFTIVAADFETGGVCDVFVEGMGSTPIPVYDDGRNGDDVANDGIYQLEYTFALSFRQRSMRMSAQFTDAVDNVSVEKEFAENLWMTDPPDPVTLNAINPSTDITSDSITLHWTRSIDDHFGSYKIYRNTVQGIDPINSVLVGSVGDQATTVFTDTNLPASTTFWYAVYVVNDMEEGAKSNEQSGTTNP